MKASLRTQLGQQLNLTPQLLQSIRLLQLTGLELELEIRQALDANPLLELEDEAEALAEEAPEAMPEHAADPADAVVDIEDADTDFDTATWGVSPGAAVDGDPFERTESTAGRDLRSHLLAQYALEVHRPGELLAADFLIDQLDASGYLCLDADALRAEAAGYEGVDPDLLEPVRRRLMRLDPPGIGARSLAECLDVQLQALPRHTPGLALARRIVAEALEQLADPDPDALAAALGTEAAQLRTAHDLVLSLNPRPAGLLAADDNAPVVPDVVVERVDGRWRVRLNEHNLPRIRINPVYERMLGESGDGGELRGMLAEARWLTRGLAMRFDTLLRATQAIVERQQAFFERGEEAMVPLNLKDIAEAIGMHESTISRIANGKYVQTPRGTLELKRFFPVKLDGAEVSGSAVKAMVKKLVDGESPDKPLSDDQVMKLLALKGVRIARRTVAKYRDQLGIPAAKDRRRRHTGGRSTARTG